MAYTTINKSTDYFNTVTYSGNGNNNHTITGVGFDADFVWNKLRSGTDDNRLFDKVRGINKYVESSNTTAEVTDAILSTNSDGYVLTDAGEVNSNTGTYVSWNWKANGAGSANTDGSTGTTVSVNTTAGFSIVKWTGTSGNTTIGHGLGVIPSVVIAKNTGGSGTNWIVYHKDLSSGYYVKLNLTNSQVDGNAYFTADPTNNILSLTGSTAMNNNGNSMIAYCFAEKTGYSKFGSYVGNGSTDGAFIYTGFKPAFFMAKRSSAAGDPWVMIDNKRNSFNALSNTLLANSADAENTGTDRADFISNGIKIKTTSNAWNANGSTYIYMAFGQSIVGSNNIPATAR
ncbi:hypothetical protein OAH93_00830 [Flavobacteriales bacterium]|nr:hypothetical protein [Flavobacteriales bacterium]